MNFTARITEIDTRREAIRTELAESAALPEPTDEDVARTDALLDEDDALRTELEPLAARAVRVEAVRTATATPGLRENGFGAPNVITRDDPFENLDALRFQDPNSDDVIARAITAISEVRSRGTSDADRESAVRVIENVPGAAVHALVYGSPAYRSAFQQWGLAASRGQTPVFSAEENEAMRTALSLTGANGGYVLPTLLDPTLIKTGTAVKNNIRRISRVETITQNVWHGATIGNVVAYWTAEGSALTDGNPTLGSPSITAAKLTCYLPGSYEIFEDSSMLAQLPGLCMEGMSFVEDTAFISGSGSGAPKGIITAISATAASTVTVTTRGSFTSASSADVYAVVNAVTPRYEESVTWVGNKKTFNIINTMSPNGGGSLYWKDLNSPATNRPPLLGSPTVGASDMDTAYASGTAFLILGDFSQYLIVDRIGMSVELMQNVVDGSGLPTGQRALVCHKRVGADVTDLNAFRFLKA